MSLQANRSVNADAQSRSAAAPRRSLVAGYVRRYPSRMKEVVAHALATHVTRRLAVAFEAGWHHVPSNCSLRACGRPGVRAQHFSGGPSRVFGRAAHQPGGAPANPKKCRALGGFAAASCQSALKRGLALARAASDNKLIDTDDQGRSAAALRRSLVAGHRQR